MASGCMLNLILRGIYYVYITRNSNVIIKFLNYSNGLNEGNFNSYGHKLIYKVNIEDYNTFSDSQKMNNYRDYLRGNKKRWGFRWKR